MIFSIARGFKKIAKNTFHLKKRETPLSLYRRLREEHKKMGSGGKNGVWLNFRKEFVPDPIFSVFSHFRIRPGGKRDFTLFLSKKYRDELMAAVFIIVLGGVFMTASATQRTNMPIPYQGRLLDSNYVAKADETYYMRFGIFTAATGGTCLWATGGCTANAPTSSVTTSVSRGLFTVLLGNGDGNDDGDTGDAIDAYDPEIDSSITGNFNTGTYFLEVRQCGTNDSSCETLSPRKQLSGSLFSYNPDFLDGISSAGFAILAGQSGGQTLIGGTATTDDLILKTTSGAAISGADMIFQTGNNGGTEAMRILYTGNVGIGTASPTALASASSRVFDIAGNSTLPHAELIIQSYNDSTNNRNAYLTLKSSGAGDSLAVIDWRDHNSSSPSPLVFQYAGSEKMRITSGGNVGIGATSPAAHLQIDGNISAAAWTTDGIAFDSNAATYTDTSTAGAGTVAVRTANSFGAPTFASSNAITVTDAFTLYVPKPIAGTNTTITRTNSAYFEGNVGIGTTAPGAKLAVAGTSGSSNYISSALINNTTAKGTLFYMAETEDGSTPFYIERWGSTHATLPSRATIYNSGLLRLDTAANKNIALMPGSGGNVGIGTTSPSQLLHVSSGTGSASANRLVGVYLDTTGSTGGTEYSFLRFATPTYKDGGGTNFEGMEIGLSETDSAFYFNTNVNTGITGASMVIDQSTGNVGIGTTAPAGVFDVRDATSGLIGFSTSADVFGEVYMSSGNTINGVYNTNANGELWLNYDGYQAGTTQFRDLQIGDGKRSAIAFFDGSSGNVGIGTTSPGYKLEILGATQDAIQTVTRFSGKNAAGNVKALDFKLTGSTPLWTIDTAASGTDAALSLATAGTSRIYITNAGLVGIGTTSPAVHLQIDGDISASAWTTDGIAFDSNAATYTDTSTAASGTVTVRTANSFGAPTFASTNAITVTDAFTLYVPKPIAGTNTTITRANSAYFEGNVGIGTTAPTSILNVRSSTSSYGQLRVINPTTNGEASIGYRDESDVDNASWVVGKNLGGVTDDSFAWYINGTKMSLSNTGVLKVGGLSASGAYVVCTGVTDTGGTLSVGASASSCTASDLRLKTNIVPLTDEMNVLNSLGKLNGVYFNWKTDVAAGKDLKTNRHFGLIAQDVERVFPELVSTNKDGMKGLEYDKLTAYLIEVAKAQQSLLDPLSKGIAVDKDGRIGIGTIAPTATLDLHEKQLSDDGIGKQVFGLSAAVSSGDEPNYTIYQGKILTTSWVPTATINRLSVRPNALYSIEVKIIQRNPANGNGGSYTLKGVFKTDASSPPVITQANSNLDILFRDNALSVPSFDVSENGIIKITVTGDERETNAWHSTIFVSSVGN
ncbi:tail fiber domain-containing protein [Candidatus Uhrbacteria bacterium]|nr:tail fiber domain-containing protein [Candidatus Uhrbacteria bacterium]